MPIYALTAHSHGTMTPDASLTEGDAQVYWATAKGRRSVASSQLSCVCCLHAVFHWVVLV